MSLPSFSILFRRRRRDLCRRVAVIAIAALLSPCVGVASENRHAAAEAILCEEETCRSVAILVWDGDSFILHDARGGREKIRIENIDAPEIDGRCAAEQSAAVKATGELVRLLDGKRITLMRGKLDRYRRQLARVISGNRDVGDRLVTLGLARRWDGWRKPWCSG